MTIDLTLDTTVDRTADGSDRAPTTGLKDLLRTADLTPGDIGRLLDLATQLRGRPDRALSEMAGELVVLYFTKPSTRTRLSFAAAASRVGAMAVTVGPTELQLGRGETIEDTARVVSGYASALVVRTYADYDVRRLARAATIPVINGLTDGHHPCQSLADLLTLQDCFGSLPGLRVAYVGDGNNVAHSLIEACALTGVDISVATPPDYEPDADVVAGARRLAARSGSEVRVGHDPSEAVAGADAVYTDVWLSMGDARSEQEDRRAALALFQVNAALMAQAAPRAVFMHCLPAHRGDEVTAEVIGSSRSLVFRQAENRLHTAGAVILALRRRSLLGAVAGDLELGDR